jgi:Lipopolysaccharide-assembly
MRPRAISVAFAATALALAGALYGCGYHFAASGSNLPPDAKTVYVAPFGNRTRVTGINDQFMRYLKDEIANHHRLRLVDSPAQADLELSGEVLTAIAIPTGFNSVIEPTIYSQSLSVAATLRDLRTNKVIWSTTGLGNAQQARVVAQSVVPTQPTFLQYNLRGSDIAQLPDLQVAQTQNYAAEDLVMTQIAKDLYDSMSQGF